jgi:hypothetical protein
MRIVLPAKSFGDATSALIGVGALSVTPAPIFVSSTATPAGSANASTAASNTFIEPPVF